MFGLPAETAAMVFGFPLFWVIYTIVFLLKTRDWEADDSEDERA